MRQRFSEIRADLQQQRRFADAGRTAHQNQRPAHTAAAQHAVKLLHAGGETNFLLSCHVFESFRDGTRDACPACRLRGRHFFVLKLHDGVPCPAGGALALPARRLVAALLADKNGFRFHSDAPLRATRTAFPRSRRPAFSDTPAARAAVLPRNWIKIRIRPARRCSRYAP